MVSKLFVIGLMFQCAVSAARAESSDALQSPAPSPSVSPAAIPLSDAEKKSLLAEFKKARRNAERARKHQDRAYLKQLVVSQRSALKNWREQEKKARHDYFLKHTSGPERREYVQSYIERKKKYEEDQKKEKIRSEQESVTQAEMFKKNLNNKESEFKAKIQEGVRPGPELWP